MPKINCGGKKDYGNRNSPYAGKKKEREHEVGCCQPSENIRQLFVNSVALHLYGAGHHILVEYIHIP